MPRRVALTFRCPAAPRSAAPLAGNSRANHPRWQRSGATAVVTGTGVATPTWWTAATACASLPRCVRNVRTSAECRRPWLRCFAGWVASATMYAAGCMRSCMKCCAGRHCVHPRCLSPAADLHAGDSAEAVAAHEALHGLLCHAAGASRRCSSATAAESTCGASRSCGPSCRGLSGSQVVCGEEPGLSGFGAASLA
jgi:hypothetical protein